MLLSPEQSIRVRREDLKAQGEAGTRTVERLRKELEENRNSLLDLEARYPNILSLL